MFEMKSEFGDKLRIEVNGESHGEFVAAIAYGVPAGFSVDMEKLSSFMKRRQGGNLPYTTPRKEDDIPVFESGIDKDGKTDGKPLTVKIYNKNVRSGDYSGFTDTPRPSHADYTAIKRYGSGIDLRGGGHFSARLTAPLVAIGGILKQMLESKGIFIGTHLAAVGNISDTPFSLTGVCQSDFDRVLRSPVLPVIDAEKGEEMAKVIISAMKELDSVGGIAECAVIGLDAGYGEPLYGGIENRIAGAMFGLGGVRGIEFGLGFEAVKLRGSVHNDPFTVRDGKVVTVTNNCGGVIGGISDGMPVVFRAAFKPTASIAREQDTVSLSEMRNVKINIKGRHDPCIAIRALPCVEAVTAAVLTDIILEKDGEISF